MTSSGIERVRGLISVYLTDVTSSNTEICMYVPYMTHLFRSCRILKNLYISYTDQYRYKNSFLLILMNCLLVSTTCYTGAIELFICMASNSVTNWLHCSLSSWVIFSKGKHFLTFWFNIGAMGSVVGWGTTLLRGKVTGLIPDESLNF
jgi:hypothetical protein